MFKFSSNHENTNASSNTMKTGSNSSATTSSSSPPSTSTTTTTSSSNNNPSSSIKTSSTPPSSTHSRSEDSSSSSSISSASSLTNGFKNLANLYAGAPSHQLSTNHLGLANPSAFHMSSGAVNSEFHHRNGQIDYHSSGSTLFDHQLIANSQKSQSSFSLNSNLNYFLLFSN
jgi:hypothetical protein